MTPLEFSTRADWLEWRRSGIGASDTPIILGISKFKKPFTLFEEKTGRREPAEVSNPAIDKGNALEPVARAKFAARWNFINDASETFDAKNVVSPTHPFMRASLDGISKDSTLIIEIKYQGALAHADAKLGKISEMYFAQVQHQLFCSGALKAVLVSIGADETIYTVNVARDEAYISGLVKSCSSFWECVKQNHWPSEAPWLVQGGTQVMVAPVPMPTDSAPLELSDLFFNWSNIVEEIKQLELAKKHIQEKIFKTEIDVCGNFRVINVERKGNVDWKKMVEELHPELLDNQSNYRGETTFYKQIKIVK